MVDEINKYKGGVIEVYFITPLKFSLPVHY